MDREGEGSAWSVGGGGVGRGRGGTGREGESPKETTISVSQYHAGFRTGVRAASCGSVCVAVAVS